MARALQSATRYSYQQVVEEIRRRLNVEPRGTKKRLGLALHYPDHSDFSHRLANKITSEKEGALGLRFTIEELGIIAEELNAPPGWPFLDWKTGEALRGITALAEAHAHRK